MARPLHALLQGIKNGRKAGNIGYIWQKPQQEAFKQLITAFTTAPILRYYNPAFPIRIKTDASDFALAAILSQLYPDGWHPIAFLSKKIINAKDNYPIYDKKLMAIVIAFRYWRYYLEGTINIEVWSDHKNLKKFISQTTINGR